MSNAPRPPESVRYSYSTLLCVHHGDSKHRQPIDDDGAELGKPKCTQCLDRVPPVPIGDNSATADRAAYHSLHRYLLRLREALGAQPGDDPIALAESLRAEVERWRVANVAGAIRRDGGGEDA